jgi:threonine dehydrogenase-like Zn-dependent dehydrogenase
MKAVVWHDIGDKNLTVKLGNCNHRRYLPKLMDLVAAGTVDPSALITRRAEPASPIEACRSFDRREEGRLKTVLDVS